MSDTSMVERARVMRWLPLLLAGSATLLLTSKSAFNIPYGVMTLLGLVAATRRSVWADPDVRLLLALFACIWLPILISLPDAVNLARSTKTAVSYLHFLFAGIFLVQAFRGDTERRQFLWVIGLFCCVLAADGLLQAVRGANILGNEHAVALTGLFHPKQRLAIVLAALLPLVFEWLRRSRAPLGAWVPAALLVVAVIVLGNKRSAWLMLAFVLVAWPLLTAWLQPGWVAVTRRPLTWAGVAILVLGVGLFAGTSDRFLRQVDLTSGILELDREQAEVATAYRVSLWRTAWNIFKENPLNGIGPRGYRYVYEDYAGPDDFWIKTFGHGQTHPHGMALEILAETGLVGALGFLLFWTILVRRAVRVRPCRPEAGWLVAVAVAWLPLNVHLAFYGTYWSSVAWLVLPVAVASLSTTSRTTAPRLPYSFARKKKGSILLPFPVLPGTGRRPFLRMTTAGR